VEHPCYRCGQVLEQGIPFCPYCGAPQIRVVIAEPEPALAVAGDGSESAELSSDQAVPVLAVPMRWSSALKPCILAAMVGSLLMFLGLYPLVAMLSVGFLAVIFFRQSTHGLPVKLGTAARVGALAGVLWFAISSISATLLTIILHKGPEIRGQLLEKLQQTAAQANDAQVQAVFERLKSPEGLEFLMIASLVFAFVAALVLGSLGGALGGFVLGRRNRN
jgi:hypothetical protein